MIDDHLNVDVFNIYVPTQQILTTFSLERSETCLTLQSRESIPNQMTFTSSHVFQETDDTSSNFELKVPLVQILCLIWYVQ